MPEPVLDLIVRDKRAAQALREVPLATLRRQAEQAPAPPQVLPLLRPPEGASSPRLQVIAEIKRRSPSAGWLRQGADAPALAEGYRRAGAAMVSILTDGPWFGGSLEDLAQVVARVPLPALRKDFLLDEYDLCAARCAGAAAVLLIVRIFPDQGELRDLIACAGALGMAALVEAHTLAEAVTARQAGAALIGINHRDLQSLRVDLSLSASLRGELGDGPVLVAESGLRSAVDLRLMARRGMDAVLIGESLMRQPDPGLALRKLLDELDKFDEFRRDPAP